MIQRLPTSRFHRARESTINIGSIFFRSAGESTVRVSSRSTRVLLAFYSRRPRVASRSLASPRVLLAFHSRFARVVLAFVKKSDQL